MIDELLNRPCTIRRTTDDLDDLDEYGTPRESVVDVATTCALQQRQADETDQELSATGWVLFLRADETLGAGDTVVVDTEYEVVGRPSLVHDEEHGTPHHLEAQLKQVTGSAQ